MIVNSSQPTFGMSTPKIHRTGMTQQHLDLINKEWDDLVEIGKTVAVDIRRGEHVVNNNFYNKPPVISITVSKDMKSRFEKILHFCKLMPDSTRYTENLDPVTKKVTRQSLKDTAEQAKKDFLMNG